MSYHDDTGARGSRATGRKGIGAVITFHVVVNTWPVGIVSGELDTEDLIGLIIGNNKSYTKVLAANTDPPITITFQRAEVEE